MVVYPQYGPRWFQVTDYTRAAAVFMRLQETYPVKYYNIKARTICLGEMKAWEINCQPVLERFFLYLRSKTGSLKVRVKVQRRKVPL